MAENHPISSCLIGIMDQLWFHQVILYPKILQQSSMAAASSSSEHQLSNNSSAHTSGTQVISEENSSIVSNQEDEYYSNEEQEQSDDKGEEEDEERPKRLNLSGSEMRCHSFSPSGGKRRSDAIPGGARRRLSKTMSCKTLCELELEEVKGFIDLGFTFNKEHLNKRMMSVIPGLQRLENKRDHQTQKATDKEEEDEEGELLERGGVIRPYLSEAWLVKRPDSPLLNLRRIQRVSTADDMKKHLKYWAKTVASAVQLES